MIPVFEPVIDRRDIEAVNEALSRGEISGSGGQSLDGFEREFAAYCGSGFGVAVTSGTTALQLAVRAAGIGPGDEVLISASTNIATALAVVHNGAMPVPVDSEARTGNLDLDLVSELVSPRTKAILPVHLFGHPVDMDRLCSIAEEHGLVVIEDAAEAHGARCRDRRVGAFGAMGCFSFYANKVITCGEGGMIVTNDPALDRELRLLRNLGFKHPRFEHDVAAYNFRMTGYQAALGRSQLARIDETIAAKRRVAELYTARLSGIEGLQLPAEEDWAFSVFWMFGVVVQEGFGLTRDALAAALGADGIETRTFFCPMNRQPCLLSLPDFDPAPCPVADRLWEKGLYLPSSTTLDEATIDRIGDAVESARR